MTQRQVRFVVAGILFLFVLASIFISGCSTGNVNLVDGTPEAVPAHVPEAQTVVPSTPLVTEVVDPVGTPAPERMPVAPDLTATPTVTPTITLTPTPVGTPSP